MLIFIFRIIKIFLKNIKINIKNKGLYIINIIFHNLFFFNLLLIFNY